MRTHEDESLFTAKEIKISLFSILTGLGIFLVTTGNNLGFIVSLGWGLLGVIGVYGGIKALEWLMEAT